MTIAQFIVAYSVCWWLMLFILLPDGAAPVQNPVPGHAPSAPANPRLRRKFKRTTIFAILPTLLIYFVATAAKAQEGIYHVGSGCATLEPYTPSADLEVKDGYGTKEQKIAPANLDSSTVLGDMESVNIPLKIPSANYLDESKYNADFSESFAHIGDLKVGMNDTVTLNGRPVNIQAMVSPECEPKKE